MSNQDPAVEIWRDAALRKELRIRGYTPGTVEWDGAEAAARSASQSTSARLRQVERERDEACALSVELLRDTERLRTENGRLLALLDALPGYHLTEKGLAATEADRG